MLCLSRHFCRAFAPTFAKRAKLGPALAAGLLLALVLGPAPQPSMAQMMVAQGASADRNRVDDQPARGRKAAPKSESRSELDDEQQYKSCLLLVGRKPEDAFEAALVWRDRGGGFPARHCAALALVELKQYGDAADRLEKIAEDMAPRRHRLLGEVLGQAGNAWLLAGLPERAYGVFTSALAVEPENADLLLDRARASALVERWSDARRDLDAALRLDPSRDDAYAYRAAARRRLNDAAGALEDAETALAINPKSVDALVERGYLRKSAGDIKGARADWIQVRLLMPNTPAADVAGYEIEHLDLRTR